MTDRPAKVVLASASPIRKRLLEAAGVSLSVVTSSVDETEARSIWTGNDDEKLALFLATAKARDVLEKMSEDSGSLVIGVDQILVEGGERVDKARSLQEAADHLRRLSGCSHELVSACTIMNHQGLAWQCIERAKLTMRPLSGMFIDRYLEQMGEDALRSVGCYQLEGLGAQLFEKIKGDYFTVLGLPLLPILRFLRTQKVLDE